MSQTLGEGRTRCNSEGTQKGHLMALSETAGQREHSSWGVGPLEVMDSLLTANCDEGRNR